MRYRWFVAKKIIRIRRTYAREPKKKLLGNKQLLSKVSSTVEFARTWGRMKANRSEEMNYEKVFEKKYLKRKNINYEKVSGKYFI